MCATADAAGSGTHHPELMSLELACTAPQILCAGLMRVSSPVHMLQLNSLALYVNLPPMDESNFNMILLMVVLQLDSVITSTQGCL